MSGNHQTDPKALRAGLDFPVIDSDGHWLEYGPVVVDYLKKVGGNAAVDGFTSRDRNVASTILMSPERSRSVITGSTPERASICPLRIAATAVGLFMLLLLAAATLVHRNNAARRKARLMRHLGPATGIR